MTFIYIPNEVGALLQARGPYRASRMPTMEQNDHVINSLFGVDEELEEIEMVDGSYDD